MRNYEFLFGALRQHDEFKSLMWTRPYYKYDLWGKPFWSYLQKLLVTPYAATFIFKVQQMVNMPSLLHFTISTKIQNLYAFYENNFL